MPKKIKDTSFKEAQVEKAEISTPPSKMGLFMLSLLLFSPLAAATNVRERDRVDLPDYDPNNIAHFGSIKPVSSVEKHCKTSPLRSVNKPPGVTLGHAVGTDLKAQSCIINPDSKQCKEEKALLESFRDTSDLENHFKLMHSKHESQYKIWEKEIRQTLVTLIPSLTSQQKETFKGIVDILLILKSTHLAQSHALKGEGLVGNCMEQNAVTLHKLIQQNIASDSKLEIQYVYVRNSEVKTGVSDHVYLLLGAKNNQPVIKNGKKEVEGFFKTIDGYLCDSWNGVFENSKESKNTLYKKGWDTVEISRPIELNFLKFPNFLDLPKLVKQIVCEQFELMNLLVPETKTYCRRMKN